MSSPCPEDPNSQDHRPPSGTQKPAPSVSDLVRMRDQAPHAPGGARRVAVGSRVGVSPLPGTRGCTPSPGGTQEQMVSQPFPTEGGHALAQELGSLASALAGQ